MNGDSSDGGGSAGLVLGGGGARGAYASGALSVLLPELKDQVPVSSLHAPSLLHPEPLERTLGSLVHFDRPGQNIREQRVAVEVGRDPSSQQQVGRLSPGRGEPPTSCTPRSATR